MDTGSGIDSGNQAALFNLFGKVKVSEDQISQQGIGLGLTVSSILCEKMLGKIFLQQTKEGKGSKFIVYIPVHIVQ